MLSCILEGDSSSQTLVLDSNTLCAVPQAFSEPSISLEADSLHVKPTEICTSGVLCEPPLMLSARSSGTKIDHGWRPRGAAKVSATPVCEDNLML